MPDELLGADVQQLANVASFVDDDLLSCFLWAAGENAVAQPGWESPSVTPLRGIPLPPKMELLPAAASAAPPPAPPPLPLPPLPVPPKGAHSVACSDDDDDDDAEDFGQIRDSDIEDISKMSVPMSKEQKLTQRMQRKAESARVARLRKKEYVGGLEEQIKDLTAALAAAREANKRAAAAVPAAVTVTSAAAGAVGIGGAKTDSTGTNSDKKPPGGTTSDRLEVNGTVEQFVANKRKQQETLNEYLDCIEDILSPSAPLHVAFNPSGGADAAASDTQIHSAAGSAGEGAEPTDEAGSDQGERDPKRQRRESVSVQLTRELTVELGLTAQQVDGLAKLQREFVRPDKEVVADCMRLIRQLRGRLTEHMGASQKMTDSMRRILSDEQVPRYLDWVSRRHSSMAQLSSFYE